MPQDSIQPVYNPPAAQSWEEMCQDRNENVTPSVLTDGLGQLPLGNCPVWINKT